MIITLVLVISSVRIHPSQQKVKHHFQFQFDMYDKKIKVWHHMILTLSACHKLSHVLGPSPLTSPCKDHVRLQAYS